MTVVSDTSPISYLVLTRTEEVIPELYGEVRVPEAVHRELVHPDGPEVVRERISDSPAWIKEETVGSDSGERSRGKEERGDLKDLDPGEREAIRLSVQEEAGLLLIDERAGRTVARMYGIKVTGTIGVLGAVAHQGLIDPAETNLVPSLCRSVPLAPRQAAIGTHRSLVAKTTAVPVFAKFCSSISFLFLQVVQLFGRTSARSVGGR